MLATTPLKVVAALFLMQLPNTVRAEDSRTMLFDFSKPDTSQQWQTVNDGVMGGVSEGNVRITKDKTLEFFGNLSLENNGGFASSRTRAGKLDLSQCETLLFKVRGDGRTYDFNIHVPTEQIAFSYRAKFVTEKDKWQEIPDSARRTSGPRPSVRRFRGPRLTPRTSRPSASFCRTRRPGPSSWKSPGSREWRNASEGAGAQACSHSGTSCFYAFSRQIVKFSTPAKPTQAR